MSVLLETSLGDIVIDLFVDKAPRLCENFLKLCKLKYYNFSPVHSVQKNFSFQTGDPLGPDSKESDGGSSVWGLLQGQKTFTVPTDPKMKHVERGTVSMVTVPSSLDEDHRDIGSQFIITLGENLDYLDGKAAIFGLVVEGFDTLEKVNEAFIDVEGRPLKDIRIRHTSILDDPYDDPPGLREPSQSPLPSKAQLATVMIADDEELDENADEAAVEKLRREREARAQALTLEVVGDLPFAEVKPPENVLFVCKLNPITQDEDLNLIFSRFGKILSCEVIRDVKTGDSLHYAFIEFENQKDCEQAYSKMEGVLIDDHRIHVDFSQSVSRLLNLWRTPGDSRHARQTGGFGGISSLEKRSQYRESERSNRSKYGMVFDRNDLRKGRRSRSRSGSPPGERRYREDRDRESFRRDRRDVGYGRDRRERRDSRDRSNVADVQDRRDRRDPRRERYDRPR
ncbi:MAG: hypothetical protein Q9160_005049 [Pyrenula sp. 1 TL-2023]